MKRAIAYYRVSTEHQGRTGYGIDAQRVAVLAYASANDYQVLEELQEVGSSVDNHRATFQKALLECREQGAVLIAAKLDRVSRSVRFITELMETGVPFKVVDVPSDDELHLLFTAVMAQYEIKQIRARTRAGLQAAKKKGVELGKQGKHVLAPQNKAAADAFARLMEPMIRKLQEDGIVTVRGIAKALNKKRKRTFHQHKWYPNTVHRLLKRIEAINDNQSTKK